MSGGFDKKPGGTTLVQAVPDGRAESAAGRRTLTEQLGDGAPVMRKAGGAGAGHAAGPHSNKLVIPRPIHKPGGGMVSDPQDHGAAAPRDGAAAPRGSADRGAAAGGESHAAGAVQAQGDVGDDTASVHAAAAHGIAGSAGPLPHLGAIQAAFGPHDVSSIQAHTDANAAAGSQAMGAEAYATGSHVAFAQSQPSLHTAAHEAAHVVQQRGGVQLKGGVGQVGDAYEQHADAVADRVVQGKSAVDLLDPHAGGPGADGRGAGGVQHQAVQKRVDDAGGGAAAGAAADLGAGAGAAAAPGAPAAGVKHHYEIELKAWIPFAHVVDPEEPARLSDWLDTVSTIASAIADAESVLDAKLNYEFHSYYRGDGHHDYPGGYRVLSKASFDYDGTAITGFSQVGSYGTSHRDWDYRAWLDITAGFGPFRTTLYSRDITKGSGTESKTATSATGGAALTATSFNLSMSSANPLVITWAPTIDSELTGSLDPKGDMTMRFGTDLFPSHGIQVSRDGAMIKQQIVNDPSGINPLGPIGAADIGRRLVSHSNAGTLAAP